MRELRAIALVSTFLGLVSASSCTRLTAVDWTLIEEPARGGDDGGGSAGTSPHAGGNVGSAGDPGIGGEAGQSPGDAGARNLGGQGGAGAPGDGGAGGSP